MTGIFGRVDLIEKGLNAAWMRNSAISNNIANVDTPGFKSSRVVFETEFKKAINNDGFEAKRTRDKHIYKGGSNAMEVSPSMALNNDTTMRLDGNNVDIDYENAELAKNQIYYSTLGNIVASEFRKINMAINEGK
ncbi:MAG: flagellar basal body rod protein FlgB [Christensenellales bacterium]|jgi:flagellar basal-body rod protein FlgB